MRTTFLLLTTLLLTCCAPIPTPAPLPTVTPIDPGMIDNANYLATPDFSSYQPAIQTLQVGPDCPHLCWLGINPGVTTLPQAYQLLQNSGQIDQDSLKKNDTGIVATWYTENSRKLKSEVYLYGQQGLVKSISFNDFAPFKIGDIIALLGDPDGVGMEMEVTNNVMDISYECYYSTKLIMLGSDATASGPQAGDGILTLSIGVPYDKKLFHAWLGYGHLREYLAKKPAS